MACMRGRGGRTDADEGVRVNQSNPGRRTEGTVRRTAVTTVSRATLLTAKRSKRRQSSLASNLL